MSRRFFQMVLRILLKSVLGVKEKHDFSLKNVKRILIVRQHNQLGDMLAGSSLVHALREAFPAAEITFIASPQNKDALLGNPLINILHVFDKKKLNTLSYWKELWGVLRADYDLCISPATVSISFTNDLLARLAKAKIRIGIRDLDGKENDFAYFFDYPVSLDWRNQPDLHIAERIIGILKPFGISTRNFLPEIQPTADDNEEARSFIRGAVDDVKKRIIGLHTGAGKPPNRWPWQNFCQLIERLQAEQNAFCYLTASSADLEVIEKINKFLPHPLPVYLNKSIGSVAALIGCTELFITNDTGIMHAAAAVPIPQISLFGQTNPSVWAPLGPGKHYIRHGEDINSISVEEVYSLAVELVNK